MLNYPITIFDSRDEPNLQTLGFFFYDTVQKTNDLKYWELLKYAQVLFETLLEAQDIDIAVDPAIQARTVRIDDFGIASTDFNITPEQVAELYQSGISCTEQFLDNIAAHPEELKRLAGQESVRSVEMRKILRRKPIKGGGN